MIRSFKDLEVYQIAYNLAVKCYNEIEKITDYTLKKETLRSARSIATNIAEGFARKSDHKVFNYHLSVAIGEANEMMVHLDLLRDTSGLNSNTSNKLAQEYEILAKKLSRLRSANIQRNKQA